MFRVVQTGPGLDETAEVLLPSEKETTSKVFPECQDQNLAVTVLYVPYSLGIR